MFLHFTSLCKNMYDNVSICTCICILLHYVLCITYSVLYIICYILHTLMSTGAPGTPWSWYGGVSSQPLSVGWPEAKRRSGVNRIAVTRVFLEWLLSGSYPLQEQLEPTWRIGRLSKST